VTSTPHDALVRGIFGQPQYAADELRCVLPPDVLRELRLETLVLADGAFVDERLRASSTDLLFRARLASGGARFVFILFEHQSTLDERMPLRLLRYQTRIWERHHAEHRDDTHVPPIVSLLLHHGRRPWPWKPRFSSVLALEAPALAAFGTSILGFDFLMDDLARVTERQILDRAMDAVSRLTLVALHGSRDRRPLFEHVAEAMRELEPELRAGAAIGPLARITRYVLSVDDSRPDQIRTALAAALSTETRSSVMTAADQLRAEGRLEARRETLLEILESKFGSVDPSVRRRIESGALEQLVVWIRRVVGARSVEEVFAA
jgi:hypothetical protein